MPSGTAKVAQGIFMAVLRSSLRLFTGKGFRVLLEGVSLLVAQQIERRRKQRLCNWQERQTLEAERNQPRILPR